MTRPHVPVLAGELVGALDPQPGEVAVDCTFGAGGHARLVANRIGPTGLLVCIDRDPAAEERFDELAAEVPCQTRFLAGSSFDMELDSGGRVTLNAVLLAHAGIAKDVVLIGAHDRLELWAREQWEQQEALDADIGEVTERLGHPS